MGRKQAATRHNIPRIPSSSSSSFSAVAHIPQSLRGRIGSCALFRFISIAVICTHHPRGLPPPLSDSTFRNKNVTQPSLELNFMLNPEMRLNLLHSRRRRSWLRCLKAAVARPGCHVGRWRCYFGGGGRAEGLLFIQFHAETAIVCRYCCSSSVVSWHTICG